MFKTTDRGARSIGRMVFGAILIGGAWVLVARRIDHAPLNAAKVIAGTWCLAFAGAWITQQLVSAARPEARDLGAISYAVPAFGMALLLPLSIQWPVVQALGWSAAEFEDWVRLAMVITPVAHLAFAGMSATRAYQIAKGRPALATTTIYVATIVVSGMPYAIMFFIPPVLVALTGVAILPLLARMPKWIEREETEPLPMAIVL
jgi:hypothetical protein